MITTFSIQSSIGSVLAVKQLCLVTDTEIVHCVGTATPLIKHKLLQADPLVISVAAQNVYFGVGMIVDSNSFLLSSSDITLSKQYSLTAVSKEMRFVWQRVHIALSAYKLETEIALYNIIPTIADFSIGIILTASNSSISISGLCEFISSRVITSYPTSVLLVGQRVRLSNPSKIIICENDSIILDGIDSNTVTNYKNVSDTVTFTVTAEPVKLNGLYDIQTDNGELVLHGDNINYIRNLVTTCDTALFNLSSVSPLVTNVTQYIVVGGTILTTIWKPKINKYQSVLDALPTNEYRIWYKPMQTKDETLNIVKKI